MGITDWVAGTFLKNAMERQASSVIQDQLSNPEIISKAWKELNIDKKPIGAPKSMDFDPMAIVDSLGYKYKPAALTYDLLRQVSLQLSVIGNIINTRVNQVASFATPYRQNKGLGFVIRHKDSEHAILKSEKKFILELERYIMSCGRGINPYRDKPRDNFSVFLKKFVTDSLILDQACHPAGTLVEMGDLAFKVIEAVVVGDLVRTHTGAIREVVEVKNRIYTGDMYTIKSGGQEITATEGHPLLAVTDKWFRLTPSRSKNIRPDWVDAKDLTSDHYLVYPKAQSKEEDISFNIFTSEPRLYPNVSYAHIGEKLGIHSVTVRAILCGHYQKSGPSVELVNNFAESIGFERKPLDRPSEVALDRGFAKLCGLYVAEGNCSGNAIQMTLHADEEDLTDFILDEFEKLGVTASAYYYKDRQAVQISASSVDLTRFFIKHFNTGSADKVIPAWLIDAKKDIRSAFLAGYLEGDGCFSKASVKFSTISKNLFSGIRTLASTLGMYTKMCAAPEREYVYKSYSRSNGEIYIGNFGGKNFKRFALFEELFVPISCRPREPFIQDDEYFYIKVQEVISTKAEELSVYNFEVAEDHSYVANGFVSHNCVEVVPDRGGRPFDFAAVDGATIRLAMDYSNNLLNNESSRETFFKPTFWRRIPPRLPTGERPAYVQIIRGIVETVYAESDLIFAVRNPRTNIAVHEYGQSEIERIITTITSHLFAEEFNRRQFMNGSLPKGILNIKTADYGSEQMEAFRRIWRSQVTSVENAWKMPVVNAEGLEFINMSQSNRDAEFMLWMDYLIKVSTAAYLIDPAEVNFDYNPGTTQQAITENSNESKIKVSKDRGLRPLLKFIAETLNKIIDRIDDHFYLEFVGLDEPSEVQRLEMIKTKVSTYMTPNEVRVEEGLTAETWGDVALHPIASQRLLVLETKEQEAAMAEAGMNSGGEDAATGDAATGDATAGDVTGAEGTKLHHQLEADTGPGKDKRIPRGRDNQTKQDGEKKDQDQVVKPEGGAGGSKVKDDETFTGSSRIATPGSRGPYKTSHFVQRHWNGHNWVYNYTKDEGRTHANTKKEAQAHSGGKVSHSVKVNSEAAATKGYSPEQAYLRAFQMKGARGGAGSLGGTSSSDKGRAKSEGPRGRA